MSPSADNHRDLISRSPERRIVPIDALVPHPKQMLYDPATDAEEDALAADIDARNLDHPIETFAPTMIDGREIYVIRDGNRRLKAVKKAGAKTIEALVRLDLPNPHTPEGTVAFLAANFERRQLDMVARVRIAIETYQAKLAPHRRLSQADLQRARDEIGKLVGRSGRSISRYLRLAQTPLPVQHAVSRGLLKLIAGEKVADLSAGTQMELADRIAGLTDAAQIRVVVAEYVRQRRPGRHKTTCNAVASFLRLLDRGLDDVEGRLDQVAPPHVIDEVKTLKRASAVIEAMLKIAGQSAKSPCPKHQSKRPN